jgi:hypothetical protein
MKKWNLLLILALLLAACGGGNKSGRTTISGCQSVMDAYGALFSGYDFPQNFQVENPAKQGNEFDVMDYFTVLDRLSMQPGYVLDYVYHFDGMGGYPVLYAHPSSQPPYATEVDMPAADAASNYLDYVQVEDSPEGYFQYALLAMLGNQFYLYWHAGYNDTQIVCDKPAVNRIVSQLSRSGPGLPVPLSLRLRAAMLNYVKPVIVLGDQIVEVRVVTFTKWGGFNQTTFTINRSSPHSILDVQEENIIPYDCGIMF